MLVPTFAGDAAGTAGNEAAEDDGVAQPDQSAAADTEGESAAGVAAADGGEEGQGEQQAADGEGAEQPDAGATAAEPPGDAPAPSEQPQEKEAEVNDDDPAAQAEPEEPLGPVTITVLVPRIVRALRLNLGQVPPHLAHFCSFYLISNKALGGSLAFEELDEAVECGSLPGATPLSVLEQASVGHMMVGRITHHPGQQQPEHQHRA
jgi:hypothetical protein